LCTALRGHDTPAERYWDVRMILINAGIIERTDYIVTCIVWNIYNSWLKNDTYNIIQLDAAADYSKSLDRVISNRVKSDVLTSEGL
jgi:hypothetical protein